MNRLCILGAGSWGTALAIAIAPRFREVRLWAHEPATAARIQTSRVNESYLPEFVLEKRIEVSGDLSKCLENSDLVLFAIPSAYLRGVCRAARASVPPQAILVSATKGLETGTLRRMSEVVAESIPGPPVAVLSGPTFAREIAAGEPAAVVVASRNLAAARLVQEVLSSCAIRLYTNDDVIGVEIGAALKNVIAIGAGICHGLGLGGNPVAALVTRGLAEMSRLAAALGGRPQTLAGLAGLGDLVLTCTGALSRNRYVGIELGKGRKLADVLASMKMVAEGVETTAAAVDLGKRSRVELPITEKMYEILYLGKPPREGVKELMERSLKGE